jgi:hypothetical protein
MSNKITGFFSKAASKSSVAAVAAAPSPTRASPAKRVKAETVESPEAPAASDEAVKKAKKRSDTGVKRKVAESLDGDGVQSSGDSSDPKKQGATVIADGTVPDIGCLVKAKVKGMWYTAQVVKHERWGISRKYSVRALTVIFDHDRPKPKVVVTTTPLALFTLASLF